uniref:Zeaxanthin epoxidaseic n=1 Tax=Rhizophora mucronata TaxID=61149 RepID=A0A2P2MN19_RHIMU
MEQCNEYLPPSYQNQTRSCLMDEIGKDNLEVPCASVPHYCTCRESKTLDKKSMGIYPRKMYRASQLTLL